MTECWGITCDGQAYHPGGGGGGGAAKRLAASFNRNRKSVPRAMRQQLGSQGFNLTSDF